MKDHKRKFVSLLETLGIFSATQTVAQVFAGFVGTSKFWSSIVGVVVFLLTLLLYIVLLRPWAASTERHPRTIVTALVGAVTAILIMLCAITIRSAARCEADRVVFYADFLTWSPLFQTSPAYQINLPLGAGIQFPKRIPVYQHAIYWYSYKLDWHLGGTFEKTASATDGFNKADMIYPKGYKWEPQPDGKNLRWNITIPLQGVDELLFRIDNYNCFFKDNHHYGFILRLPAHHVEATFDFSRLNLNEVFDLSYQPNLKLWKISSGGSLVDLDCLSRWNEGILYATVDNLQTGDMIYLDCVWKK